MSLKTPHLSLDLWDTVLRRRCHPDEVKLHTAQRMLHMLRPFPTGREPSTLSLLVRRQTIEAQIGHECRVLGGDDEYEIEEVLCRCLSDCAGKEIDMAEAAALVRILVAGEIEQEIAVSFLDSGLLALLASCEYEHLHVISDFYMSSDKVRRILDAHSFTLPIRNLFLSCDCRVNKRSGRLYQHVCATIGAAPQDLFHIGDNSLADVEMATRNGVRTMHFTGRDGDCQRRRHQETFLQRQRTDRGENVSLVNCVRGISEGGQARAEERERLCAYGHWMSPFFVGFALFIQERCQRGGHDHAYFFTREGQFFRQVFERVQAHSLFGMAPVAGELLPVSRLATFFPSLRELTPSELMRLWSQYHTQSVISFLESLGVVPDEFLRLSRDVGIDPGIMRAAPWQDEGFLRLLADRNFSDRLSAVHQEKRQALVDYFRTVGFGRDSRALVVDIGWRGTIQDNLARIFPECVIEGCYLGLQKFFNPQPVNVRKYGYAADENQSAGHSMLAHVMPLEMLCFGSGGSAIGYHGVDGGGMTALFRCDPAEEQFHQQWILPFQEGVLSAVDEVCGLVARHGISVGEMRREAGILATHFLHDPPLVMCRAFDALKQDDTFGMARTIFPGANSFRFGDRLLAPISAVRRERLRADLERSGWPRYLLRTRYGGIFDRLGRIRRWWRNGALKRAGEE